MNQPQEVIDNLLRKIVDGDIAPDRAWGEIRILKDQYIEASRKRFPEKDPEQSWHVFIGNKFQKLVYSILKGYLTRLKSKDKTFQNFDVMTESEIKKNEVVVRKLSVKYGEYLLLPDTDMAIVQSVFGEPWKSEIIAIISCKTSLRERIAQACYWKLKLLSSEVTKNVQVFLATTDNDEDFVIQAEKRESFDGRSRNRIIAEYELDGIYILKEDFIEEWESAKVKRYERIFEDLQRIFRKK
jgi:hypothetical protein